MNMDGKRFGAGMVGGLLLGLLIIGTTAFSGGLSGTFGVEPAQNVGQVSSVSTSVTISVTTELSITSTGAALTASSTIAYTGSPGSNSSSILTSVSSSAPSVSSIQTSAPFSGGTGSNTPTAKSNQLSPSRLDNLAAQPLLLNGLVLLPILVAIALGALLYRTSGIKSRAEEEPAAE